MAKNPSCGTAVVEEVGAGRVEKNIFKTKFYRDLEWSKIEGDDFSQALKFTIKRLLSFRFYQLPLVS